MNTDPTQRVRNDRERRLASVAVEDARTDSRSIFDQDVSSWLFRSLAFATKNACQSVRWAFEFLIEPHGQKDPRDT